MERTTSDSESLVGEACHIVGDKTDGPRGNSPMSLEDRNEYPNLILLCNVHHKQVDDQVNEYPVDRLHELKKAHEEWISSQLSFDREAQGHDETWASDIEVWERRLHLDDWRAWTSYVFGHGRPEIDEERFEDLIAVNQWLLTRVHPPTHPALAAALRNFRLVAQDFCNVFSLHAKIVNGYWRTDKFYEQGLNWSETGERELLKKYESHVALVQDLMLELTRAANLVCDRVRESLLPSFRLLQGRLLVTAGPNQDLSNVTMFIEYSKEERSGTLYPGLQQFKSVRFTRQVHFAQEGDVV